MTNIRHSLNYNAMAQIDSMLACIYTIKANMIHRFVFSYHHINAAAIGLDAVVVEKV